MKTAAARQFTPAGAPDNRRRLGKPALPPMPDKPSTCRWCRGRRLFLDAGLPWYCPRGCAANDRAQNLGQCQECGRDFDTGHPRPVLCYPCETREMRELIAGYQSPDPEPRVYSTAWMREYLGVTGDRDE